MGDEPQRSRRGCLRGGLIACACVFGLFWLWALSFSGGFGLADRTSPFASRAVLAIANGKLCPEYSKEYAGGVGGLFDFSESKKLLAFQGPDEVRRSWLASEEKRDGKKCVAILLVAEDGPEREYPNTFKGWWAAAQRAESFGDGIRAPVAKVWKRYCASDYARRQPPEFCATPP